MHNITLKDISKTTGCSMEHIKKLNPEVNEYNPQSNVDLGRGFFYNVFDSEVSFSGDVESTVPASEVYATITGDKPVCKAQSLKEKVAQNVSRQKETKVGSHAAALKCDKCDAPWMEIAKAEVGISESKNRSRVEEYVAQAIWGDRTGKSAIVWDKNRRRAFDITKGSMAWCSCFVCWTMDKAKFARVPVGATPEKAYNWVKSSKGTLLSPATKPPYGAIVILKNVKDTAGHATFVSNYEISVYNQKENLREIVITAVGGNQLNEVNYKEYRYREYSKGGRFYQRVWNKSKRIWEKAKDRYLVNYILPKGYTYSNTNPNCYNYDLTKGKRGSRDGTNNNDR